MASRFSLRFGLRLALTVFLLPTLTPTVAVQAQNILAYGPSYGGCTVIAATPGVTVTVWDAATWASKTTADFSAFDALVFSDCSSISCTVWDAAVASKAAWCPAVTGNILIIGGDPDDHASYTPAAVTLIQNGVLFAASDPAPGPGAYFALGDSCNSTALFDCFGAFGMFSMSADAIHKVAVHPVLNGVTDATMSNWGNSTHFGFDLWPPAFIPLAISMDWSYKPYTATDGTMGAPYILASGSNVVPIFSYTFTHTPPWTPTPTSTVTPTATISATVTWSATRSDTLTRSATYTPTRTKTPSATRTPTVTRTQTPTVTLTFTESASPTASASRTVSATWTPTPRVGLHVWPNPYNPAVAVGGTFKAEFLPPGAVLRIFTVSGELVKEVLPGGAFGDRAEWDGLNEKGRPVTPGTYYYAIRLGKETLLSGRLLILR